MEFSALRKPILDGGALQLVAKGLDNLNEPAGFRLNCAWVIKNLLYSPADKLEERNRVRDQVLEHLSWPRIAAMLGDESIREQGLAIIRNLLNGSTRDAVAVVAGFGGVDDLLAAVTRGLRDPNQHTVVHSLYLLCNLAATGEPAHKDAMLNYRPLVEGIVRCLRQTRPQVTVPALYCVLNLAWAGADGAEDRQRKLLATDGLEDTLRGLKEHSSIDVAERAQLVFSEFVKNQTISL